MEVFGTMAAQALANAQMYAKEALANASLSSILRDAPDAVIATDLQDVVTFVSPSDGPRESISRYDSSSVSKLAKGLS